MKERLRTRAIPSTAAYITATLINSWVVVSSRTPRFYKDALGRVYLEGTISGGASGSIAFVLPSGYLPNHFSSFVAAGSAPNLPVAINIDAGGNVYVFYTAGTTSMALDQINFLAA